ncbi:hypothetical protein HELRODRAFT_66523 [Helobdella robusta]|uniref:RNA helicase n=1 Tax=Helobdella robusta TaxID=6412 RepID=T1FYM3_HELRO|nr:hypothetical protein HELRODRAFT_66523 [Helobdella robusta]ESN99182.1 hypothetical protein HELRODRAFT_66523 [Helobdella robusta]
MASNTSSEENASGKTFRDLGLNNWIVKQCEIVGISKPSPIQLNCIPKILEGSDCIGCAKTGSGKTAAFVLPMLHLLSEDPYGIFALIITPTRELAHQIGEHFKVLGKPLGLKYSIIIGGADIIEQGIELSNKPHIVIATPGRLADHIEHGTDFSLKKIRFLVLDEADRLLEDKFGDQLQTIFSVLPEKRQTLLFSATLTDTLQQLEHISNNKPFVWVSSDAVATVDTLSQQYVLCPADIKDAFLVHIIDVFKNKRPNSSVMIFVNTCKYCQILAMVLVELDFECVALHSMLQQKMRIAALNKFKSSQVKILVATDVASRGLDIPTVDLVINHNVPTRPKDYIHRVGRTARAGEGGMAVTLVTPFDAKLLVAIEDHIGTKLTKHDVDEKEVAKIALEVNVLRSKSEIKLEESNFGEKREINKRKKEILKQVSSTS